MGIDLDEFYYGKWWLKEGLFDNIGADVVHRNTELTAFANISQEAKYIRELNKWDIEYTDQEVYAYKLELFVLSKDFDTSRYEGVYKNDSSVRKVSKLSGYSENYVIKLLSNVSRKVYIHEVLGIDDNLSSLVDKVSVITKRNTYNKDHWRTRKERKRVS